MSPCSSSAILSVSPVFEMRARCDWTTSGSASSAGTAMGRGARSDPPSALTSSGRQIETRAQRGHLGAVPERRRDAAVGDREAQPAHRVARRVAQVVVESDTDPLAALRVPDRAFLHAVAVLLQQQRLKADLDALRLVDAARDVGRLPRL